MNRENELNKSLFRTEPACPMSVHVESWEKRAKGAVVDPFDRYAFYTSRSLFVKHPEIYLRADRHFYDHISAIPGYKNAFLENDREGTEFLPHAQYYRSPPFSFDLFPWEETKTTASCRSLYPVRYPFLPFADRRMLPLATTLKTTKNLITELEMASMRFLLAVKEQGASDEVFVVYSEQGKAGVAVKDHLINAATGEEVSDVQGKVILVFNDHLAWYPLMGRDDTGRSVPLSELVARLSGTSSLPELTPEERTLLEKVKEATRLEVEKHEAAATIAAVRCTGSYTRWFKFHDLWKLAMPAERERGWQYYGFLEQLLIRANTLSPIAAYIAACSLNATGYDKILCIDREWIDLAALPKHNFIWGHLWDECLVEYTIDESFRMNAGHCMVQACITSAILEVANIEHYVLDCEVPSSHHYVFVPEYEFTFDNGKLQSSQKTIYWNGPRGNKVIARMHYNGKFASPMAGGHYSGTFSPVEAVNVLSKLKSYYGDRILIYQSGEHEMNRKRIRMEDIPTTEDFEILLKEDWEELRLP